MPAPPKNIGFIGPSKKKAVAWIEEDPNDDSIWTVTEDLAKAADFFDSGNTRLQEAKQTARETEFKDFDAVWCRGEEPIL